MLCVKQLGYYTHVWMSSAESYLGLLDSIVRSLERSCEGDVCCWRYRRKVSALLPCVNLLYKIYHRIDHPMNGYQKHFLQLVILELRPF